VHDCKEATGDFVPSPLKLIAVT